MVSFFRTFFSRLSRRVSATVLAFDLLCGFFLGASIAVFADISTVPMMRTVVSVGVSISSLILAMLLPFLFTSLAVYLGQLWLLIPISFSKAVSFGFLGSCVLRSFGESGWLVQLLFMFSDCLILPVLCWLWLSVLRQRQFHVNRSFCVSGILLLGIVILDHHIISPFLVELLS